MRIANNYFYIYTRCIKEIRSEGKPMHNEKMQTEIDVGAEKEQQELSAEDNIEKLGHRIDSSPFSEELKLFFLLLSKPCF